MQVLDGMILDARRRTSGFSSLCRFTCSKPTPEQLLKLGSEIFNKFASPPTDLAEQAADICAHHYIRLLLGKMSLLVNSPYCIRNPDERSVISKRRKSR
jgi:hypothetical protein